MGNEFKPEMISYYDERAKEYDKIYIGEGPAIPEPDIYKNDVKKISNMASTFGKGHLIDIGCGTGFWLPYYERNCLRITLIDQSEKMFSECEKRVDRLGLKHKCHFVQGDFFEIALENSSFDSAVVGFFISHLSLKREEAFFAKLKKILKPDARLMVIDGAWSRKRKQHRMKEGLQRRVLNDGRMFTVYKRYFDKSDIKKMFKRYLFKLESFYIGEMFLAVIGENHE